MYGKKRATFELSIFCYSYQLHQNTSSGEAESGLERLHQCAEKDLQTFLCAEGPSKEFDDFRTKLAGLTRYLLKLYVSACMFMTRGIYSLLLEGLDSYLTHKIVVKFGKDTVLQVCQN